MHGVDVLCDDGILRKSTVKMNSTRFEFVVSFAGSFLPSWLPKSLNLVRQESNAGVNREIFAALNEMVCLRKDTGVNAMLLLLFDVVRCASLHY
jgi:hypothetical protein